MLSGVHNPLQIPAPGFASVVDRRVVERANELRDAHPELPGWYGHDMWTAFVASALGSVAFLPDVLAYYRQHDQNTMGMPRAASRAVTARTSLARRADDLAIALQANKAEAEIRLQALELVGGGVAAGRAQRWGTFVEATERRLRLVENGSLRLLATAVMHGDYRSRRWGGLGLRSLLRDIYRLGTGT